MLINSKGIEGEIYSVEKEKKTSDISASSGIKKKWLAMEELGNCRKNVVEEITDSVVKKSESEALCTPRHLLLHQGSMRTWP